MANLLHDQMATWMRIEIRDTHETLEVDPMAVNVGHDHDIVSSTLIKADDVAPSRCRREIRRGSLFTSRVDLIDDYTRYRHSRSLSARAGVVHHLPPTARVVPEVELREWHVMASYYIGSRICDDMLDSAGFAADED